MTDRVGKSKWILACVFVIGLVIAQSASAETGILLLAHGGSAEWNGRVTDLVAQVNATRPAEVAFGMATRANIQNAVDKLVARGVTEIVAVPLFVSSWSTVITSTEYLLGLRPEAPAALANYAKMNHAPGGTASAGHDNHVAAALSAVLARHGFDVTHARSGQEALQALVPEGAGFGVVLLDLGLPDQDGYEVCGKIRKRTSTPVIMVTARSDVRSRIHGLNLGADDYVVKPYDTGELLARIHAVSRRTVPDETTVPIGTSLHLGPVRIELPTRQVGLLRRGPEDRPTLRTLLEKEIAALQPYQ